MAGDKILVLGGTGKAGICLLRELVFRNHPTVVYCRNPSKIPAELSSNPLLEVDFYPFLCFVVFGFKLTPPNHFVQYSLRLTPPPPRGPAYQPLTLAQTLTR